MSAPYGALAERLGISEAEVCERLHRLIYSDGGHGLGAYSLGRQRSLRDYEIFSGFDFQSKVAHPDVFTGANPDPVTIHSESDWTKCISWEEAASGGG